MGNSVSCFDPVREHPPYSWPKDHPGRDAAIAELKRKRKNQKIVGSQGTAHTVDREAAKDIAAAEAARKAEEDAKKAQEEAKLKAEEEAKKAEEEAKLKAEEEAKKAEEEAKLKAEEEAEKAEKEAKLKAEEEAKKAEEEAKLKAEEEAKKAEEEAKLKAEEEAKKAEEAAAAAAAASALAEAEKKAEEDKIKAEEEAKKLEEEAKLRAEKEAKEAEEKARLEAEAEAEAVTAEKLAALDAEKTVESSSIDDRRAMFDRSGDTLPQAKDTSRDVLDPVTNEYITLEEYRERQRERAQGLVKERLEKFEEIDEEASKEKAEHDAIEAARLEVQEKADWKYKHEGETNIAGATTAPKGAEEKTAISTPEVTPAPAEATEVIESGDLDKPTGDDVAETVETPEIVNTDLVMEDAPPAPEGETDVVEAVETVETFDTVDTLEDIITKIPAPPTELPPALDPMKTVTLENTEIVEEGSTGVTPAPVV